jgi:hypothetical protein
MRKAKPLGGRPELNFAHNPISGLFKPVREAAQIGGRYRLGIPIPGPDLPPDEGHPDVSVDTDDAMRALNLEPRCADRFDLELASSLPSDAHAAIVRMRARRTPGAISSALS